MPLAQIRAMVRSFVNKPSEDALPTAEIDFFINEACRDINRRWPFAWSERSVTYTVGVGQGEVTLPADFLQARQALYGVGGVFDKLERVTREDRWLRYPQPDAVGEPAHYELYGDKLYILPPPETEGALILDYTAHPAHLGTAAATNAFVENAKDAVTLFAVHKAYSYHQEIAEAQLFDDLKEKAIATLIAEQTRRITEDYYPRAPGTMPPLIDWSGQSYGKKGAAANKGG